MAERRNAFLQTYVPMWGPFTQAGTMGVTQGTAAVEAERQRAFQAPMQAAQIATMRTPDALGPDETTRAVYRAMGIELPEAPDVGPARQADAGAIAGTLGRGVTPEYLMQFFKGDRPRTPSLPKPESEKDKAIARHYNAKTDNPERYRAQVAGPNLVPVYTTGYGRSMQADAERARAAQNIIAQIDRETQARWPSYPAGIDADARAEAENFKAARAGELLRAIGVEPQPPVTETVTPESGPLSRLMQGIGLREAPAAQQVERANPANIALLQQLATQRANDEAAQQAGIEALQSFVGAAPVQRGRASATAPTPERAAQGVRAVINAQSPPPPFTDAEVQQAGAAMYEDSWDPRDPVKVAAIRELLRQQRASGAR